MTEIIAVLVLIGGAVLAVLGFKRGAASERERVSGVAREAERRRKELAARDAGEAMRSAAASNASKLK
jgi:hypothetical protein